MLFYSDDNPGARELADLLADGIGGLAVKKLVKSVSEGHLTRKKPKGGGFREWGEPYGFRADRSSLRKSQQSMLRRACDVANRDDLDGDRWFPAPKFVRQVSRFESAFQSASSGDQYMLLLLNEFTFSSDSSRELTMVLHSALDQGLDILLVHEQRDGPAYGSCEFSQVLINCPHYLLLTTYYLLLTTYYLGLTTYYLRLTTYDLLLTTYY